MTCYISVTLIHKRLFFVGIKVPETPEVFFVLKISFYHFCNYIKNANVILLAKYEDEKTM